MVVFYKRVSLKNIQKQEEAMDRWIKEEKLNRFIAGGRICEKEVREDMLKLQDEIFKATAEVKKESF